MKNITKTRLLGLVLILILLLTSALDCIQVNPPVTSFSATPVPVDNVIVSTLPLVQLT